MNLGRRRWKSNVRERFRNPALIDFISVSVFTSRK